MTWLYHENLSYLNQLHILTHRSFLKNQNHILHAYIYLLNQQNKNEFFQNISCFYYFYTPFYFLIRIIHHKPLPIRRLHTTNVHTKLTLRVKPRLTPHLVSQLGNILILQQLHRTRLHPTRHNLRSLPMPRRPRHAGLCLLHRTCRHACGRHVPQHMRRHGPARRLFGEVR